MKKFVGFKRILAMFVVVISLTGMMSISAFAQQPMDSMTPPPEIFYDYETPKYDFEHPGHDFKPPWFDLLGTTISDGNWLIIAIGAAVVFGLGGFFIGKAIGNKKKPAVASDKVTEDNEKTEE